MKSMSECGKISGDIKVIYGHIRSYKVSLGYQSSGLGSGGTDDPSGRY